MRIYWFSNQKGITMVIGAPDTHTAWKHLAGIDQYCSLAEARQKYTLLATTRYGEELSGRLEENTSAS